MTMRPPKNQGLYDCHNEKDACGVGFVADIQGRKSHKTVADALTVLDNLRHRGACGCEINTGDGAGILFQVPHAFLKEATAKLNISLPNAGEYGVGMVFLPMDSAHRAECEKIVERVVVSEGQRFLGWRDVPTDNSSLGDTAKASEPFMRQFFVGIAAGFKMTDVDAFERKLLIIRKHIQNEIRYSGKESGQY